MSVKRFFGVLAMSFAAVFPLWLRDAGYRYTSAALAGAVAGAIYAIGVIVGEEKP